MTELTEAVISNTATIEDTSSHAAPHSSHSPHAQKKSTIGDLANDVLTITSDADKSQDNIEIDDYDNNNNNNNDEPIIIKPSIALRDDPHYRINPERFNGWFRSYVRQDWGTVNIREGGEIEELRAGWIELFFDLIFVAGIVHISTESVYSLHEEDNDNSSSSSHRRRLLAGGCTPDYLNAKNMDFLFCTFVQFGLLQQLWQEQVMFESRFANEQVIDGWLRFATMAAILAMATTIQDNQEYFQGFMLSFIIAKLFFLVHYSKTSLIPRARNHCLLQVLFSGVTIIMATIILLTVEGDEEKQDHALYWLVAYGVLYLFQYAMGWMVWWFKDYHVPIPVNVPHIAERLGLFTMLILGESVISLETADIGLTVAELVIILDGFVIAYALGLLYFSCQPSEEKILSGINTHAMRSEKWRARLFSISHTILYFSLLGLGVGMKVITYHLKNEKGSYNGRQPIDTMLAGWSTFLACLSLNLIRLSHPFEHRTKWVWGVRILCLIALAVLPIFWQTNNALILGIDTAAVLIQVIVDEEGKEVKKEMKHETKEKVKEAVHRQQTGAFSARSQSASGMLGNDVKSNSLKDRTNHHSNNNHHRTEMSGESTSTTVTTTITAVTETSPKAGQSINKNNNGGNITPPTEEIRNRKGSKPHRPHLSNTSKSNSLRSPHAFLKKQVSGVGIM